MVEIDKSERVGKLISPLFFMKCKRQSTGSGRFLSDILVLSRKRNSVAKSLNLTAYSDEVRRDFRISCTRAYQASNKLIVSSIAT